jgi:hypothetical protein
MRDGVPPPPNGQATHPLAAFRQGPVQHTGHIKCQPPLPRKIKPSNPQTIAPVTRAGNVTWCDGVRARPSLLNAVRARTRPLSSLKRTFLIGAPMSANDPKWTPGSGLLVSAAEDFERLKNVSPLRRSADPPLWERMLRGDLIAVIS